MRGKQNKAKQKKKQTHILSVTFYGIQDVLDLSKQPNIITTKRYKKNKENYYRDILNEKEITY